MTAPNRPSVTPTAAAQQRLPGPWNLVLLRHTPVEEDGLTCQEDGCATCEHGDGHTGTVCTECTDFDGMRFTWPCAPALAAREVLRLTERLSAVEAVQRAATQASVLLDAEGERRGRDAEAHLWSRVTKVCEESGEVQNALRGWLGENPRKGRTHTKEQVIDELLDNAGAALGAVEHLTGNQGLAMGMLAAQLPGKVDKLQAAVEDGLRCKGILGSRPSWMSPDQYDPCRCEREAGHDGPHACEHEPLAVDA